MKHMFKMVALRCLCIVTFFTASLAFLHLVFEGHDKELTTNYIFSRTKRAAGDCSVTLQDLPWPKREPLFIGRSKQLIRPNVVNNKAVITIPTGGSLLLACLGRNNKISGTSQQSAYLFCINAKLFLGGKEASVNDISCTNSYAPCSIKITSTSCGGARHPGHIVELGFNTTLPGDQLDNDVWLPQVEICHNIEAMYTYYTSHKVYGHSMNGSVKDPSRKSFCKRKLFKQAPIDQIYRKHNQTVSFDTILGQGAGDYYIQTNGSDSYLARGHLAPDADFVYLSEQMLTYNYANVAPQWQKINNGNWFHTLELFVRILAAKLNLTLNIYTGTHGVLQLSYGQSGLKDMYLLDNNNNSVKIPVPQVFWKMVQHSTTKACAVVVMHNNMFLTTPPTPICTPITVPSGWPDYNNQPSLAKGYFYYCDANSFNQVVPTSPDIQCTGVFNA